MPNQEATGRWWSNSSGCLSRQLSLPPFKSFLRLDFRRIFSYILLDKSKGTNNGQAEDRLDIKCLKDLIEELESSFDAICDQDYHEFVKSCDRNKHSTKLDMARSPARHVDHSFILSWALIETAKYCLAQKLAPEHSTTNQFLGLLREELSKPINCDNQLSRLTLLRFLQYLDKIILDRTSDSSHRKHTLDVAENIEQFIDANRDILKTWFFKNRQISARSALILGDPAECWRSINLRLWSDMATKFFIINQQSHDPLEMKPRISVSQTLESLDAKHWRSNLELLALSARYLGDIDLLHGLKSLVSVASLLGDDWTLIDLIISNMESNQEETFRSFMNLNRTSNGPTKVDQSSLLEFLNSCIELGKLGAQSDWIALLHSPNLKFLYEQYVASTTGTSRNRQTGNQLFRVKNWMSTWSFDPSVTLGPVETIQSQIDLALPTMINNVYQSDSRAHERGPMIEEIRDVIKSEAFSRVVLGLDDKIEGTTATIEKFLEFTSNDISPAKTSECDIDMNTSTIAAGRRHHSTCRLLRESGLSECTSIDRRNVDLIQMKAAKFNLKNGNKEYGIRLSEELDLRSTQDEWVKFSNSLTLLDASSRNKDSAHYRTFVEAVRSSYTLDDALKSCLLSKVFCRIWRGASKNGQNLARLLESTFDKSDERSAELDQVTYPTRIEQVISKQDIPIKTIAIIDKTLDEELNSVTTDNQDFTSESLIALADASFRADLILLSRACDARLWQHKQDMIVDTGARILSKIKRFNSTLSESNVTMFSSQAFIDSTIDCVWFGLKSSVISLVTCCPGLRPRWADALTLIIERIAISSPESILFETIVSRLDLCDKLVNSDSRTLSSSDQQNSEPSILLQQDAVLSSNEQKLASSIELENCRRQLAFWDIIYKAIKVGDGSKPAVWDKQVLESEAFVKEVRKISYLSGEFLRSMATRMNRRLHQYLNLFKKYANPKTGEIDNQKHLDECRVKLDLIYRCESRSIEVLKAHLDKSKTSSPVTIYDSTMNSKIWAGLMELDYRLKLLMNKKKITLRELTALIKSISTLLSFCHSQVSVIHQAFKQRLYMEQISPFLSRMKPDLVLMPGYYLDGSCQSSSIRSKLQSPVTIQKIAQNVQLIHSKTAPKKLTFIGSDGISRAYLLKAHEDLRLDKLVMELFGSINLMLAGNKQTRDYNYKLQRYAVTPVSNRSGLIQWIEAPSLCSFYKSWFQSANGRRVVAGLYKETCASVCPDQEDTDENKHKCTPPSSSQSVDLFYQLLWAKIRDMPLRRGAQASAHDQVAKPRSETTIKYRRELPASIYEEVVERLVTTLPQDLLANQLWFESPHSMGYYLRTREFTRSCAAISMAGYVIGLGDRHPENILLDSRTGRVTHIDYNVCFEVGRQLSVAERVPFRLTQSMIHAFGFAGLEGGFKRSCRRVLDLMKEHRSVILHHLDPTNLSFMIGGGGGGRVEDGTNNELVKVTDEDLERQQQLAEDASKVAAEGNIRRALSDLAGSCDKQRAPSNKRADELRSQEDDGSATSLELPASTNYDARQPGGGQITLPSRGPSTQKLSHNQDAADQSTTNQIQFDIKTPTMITPKHAGDIYGRVRSKLSGNDELLSEMYVSRLKASDGKSVPGRAGPHAGSRPQAEDLILLIDEVQSTEDQVDALILEAISNKNKAAMFEGWSPWV